MGFLGFQGRGNNRLGVVKAKSPLNRQKIFPKEVQETIITYHETEPSHELTEAPEEPVLPYTPEEVHALWPFGPGGEC